MKTRAAILAGGEGSRLGVLTAKRAKPAVPFAGKYRIIDFVLSNCVNSGLFDIMLLTQYRPHSLIEHIGAGRPWDLDRGFTGGLQVYQPYKGRADTDWYAGTADAIQQNFTFLKRGNPDLVLVLGRRPHLPDELRPDDHLPPRSSGRPDHCHHSRVVGRGHPHGRPGDRRQLPRARVC